MTFCSELPRGARNASRPRLNSRSTTLGVLTLPIVLVTVVAPSPVTAVTAVGYGAAVLEVIATLLSASAPGERSYGLPVRALSAVAASATVRVIGPTASCELATGITPAPLTAPTLGLSATTPATPAGAMIWAVS